MLSKWIRYLLTFTGIGDHASLFARDGMDDKRGMFIEKPYHRLDESRSRRDAAYRLVEDQVNER